MQHVLPFLIEDPADAAKLSPPGARPRQILLGGKVISYSLRRSKRRTIGLSVGEQGLQAAAPRWVNLAEVEAFILEKQRWILCNLSAAQRRMPQTFVWEHGARLPYLGQDIEIALTGGDLIALQARCLRVGLDDGCAAGLRDAVVGWLKVQALAHFRVRALHIASRLKVAMPSLGLSQARTQWGNCARKADGSARILLNWKLIHYDAHLIDYVVAHELAHLLHMNHSAAFWRAVERVYPQYESARRELRERAHSVPAL